MTVEQLHPGDLPDRLSDCLNTYSLLTSARFLDLWSHLGGKPVYWGVRDGDDWRVILPAVEYGHGPTKRLQILPDGFYMYAVSPTEKPVEPSAMTAILEEIAKSGYCRIHINDYDTSYPSVDGYTEVQGRSSVVRISDPDWQPPDATLRSEIRKAEREGISVESFDADRHLDGFMELCETTAERQGRSPSFSREFYEAVAALACDDDRVQWKHVVHDGRPAASHIFLRLPDMLFHWLVYFDKAFSFLKPNQYLLYAEAKKAAELGLRWLNLGATPPDAAGLSTYKQKWGGVDYTYRCLERRVWLGRLR